MLIVPVKPSNCAAVVPLKLTPPLRLSVLALSPDETLPEKPLPSALDASVPL